MEADKSQQDCETIESVQNIQQDDNTIIQQEGLANIQHEGTTEIQQEKSEKGSTEVQSLLRFLEENDYKTMISNQPSDNNNNNNNNNNNKPAKKESRSVARRRRTGVDIKTLPQFVTKLLLKNAKLDFDTITNEVSKVYHDLRKSSGLKYTADLRKSVKGCLTSDGNFIHLGDNSWTYRDDPSNQHLREVHQEMKKPSNSGNDTNEGDTTIKESQHAIEKRSREKRSRRLRRIKKAAILPELIFEEPDVVMSNHPNVLIEEGTNPNDCVALYQSKNKDNTENDLLIEGKSQKFLSSNELSASLLANKKKLLKKKKRIEDIGKYEKVYNVLDKCLIDFKKSPFPASLIKHPFDSFKGDETIDDIAKYFDISKLVGLFQCFEFFSPVLHEILKQKVDNRQFLMESEIYFRQILNKIEQIDQKIELMSSIKKE